MRFRTALLTCALVCAASAHALTLEQARVDATSLDAGSADPFRVKARVGGLAVEAIAGQPASVRLGEVTAEIPAGALRKRKGLLVWKSRAAGVKRVVVRVARSTIEVAGGGVELGAMPAPVRLELGLGGEQACGGLTWTSERRVRKAGRPATRRIADGVPSPCSSGPPVYDPVPPTVQITSPTVNDGVATADPTVTVGGVAFDDQQLAGLSWSSDRGGGASFGPAATWTVAGVPLLPGDNVITLSATDAGGNVATDTLAVTYNVNGIVFEGMPAVDPDAFFVGEATETIVRQAIAANDDLDPATVRLVRLTDAGAKLFVGSLSDDGDLARGDEIQSDGIHTGKMNMGGLRTGLQRFRVSAKTLSMPEETAWSPVLTLPIIEHLGEEQLEAAVALANEARALFANLSAQGAAVGDALAQVVALAAQRGARVAGQSESGLGAWWLDGNGLLGGMLAYDQGTLRAGATARGAAAGQDAPAGSPGAVAATGAASETPAMPTGLAAPRAAGSGELGSRRVAILAPWFATEEAADVATMLQARQCPPFDVDSWSGTDAGAERFMNLDRYGLVLIASHGDALFHSLGAAYRAEWRWESLEGQVVVLTGTTLTAGTLARWERDLRLGRMAVFPDGVAGILPSFLSRYNVRFPSSIVVAGSCRSTWNATLENAFLGRGAATVFGFDGYVASGFAHDRAVDLVAKLLDGRTTGEAFTPGLADGGAPPASFTMAGRADVSTTASDIVNTSFETDSGLAASVPGWTVSGDGRVLGALGSARPTEGARMGLISTGLGFTQDSGAIVQTVCLPPLPPGYTRMTLSWDWNFFSEEFLEYCGSQFQDSFEVSFGGVALQSTRIDDLCDQVDEADVRFDKGGVYATGWRRTSVDVTELAGTRGVLRFAAHDVGDSIFDSAILIDGLRLGLE